MKRIFTLACLFLFIPMVASAATINTFSDGSTVKSLTFSETGTQTVYLKIGKNSTISNATLNMIGDGDEWFPVEQLSSNWYQTGDNQIFKYQSYAQQFVLNNNLNLKKLGLQLHYHSDNKPRENLKIEIQGDFGGFPDGNSIYIGYISPDYLEYESGKWFYLTTTNLTLVANTSYWIFLSCIDEDPNYSWTWSVDYGYLYQDGIMKELYYSEWYDINADGTFRLSNLTFFYPISPNVKLKTTQIWSKTGEFKTSEAIPNFSSTLQSALSACTPDSYGFCLIPLNVYSGSRGIINLTNLNIQLETTIACTTNAGCNDGNPCSTDTCVSPGTALSYCANALDYDPCCVTANNCPWTNMTCISNVCTAPTTTYCGDGSCNGGESSGTCCIDCSCPDEQVCSNNTCVGLPENETVETYSYCGDGICAGGNETEICCADCGCAAGRRCVSNVCTGMECPTSCDDGNECTEDFCSSATNYLCAHSTVPDCCGNGICEFEEDCSICEDCECETGYICEGIRCIEKTCAIAGESCDIGCCSGLICCNGICKVNCLTINETIPGTGSYLSKNITLNNRIVEVEVSREFEVSEEDLGQLNITVDQAINISSAAVRIDRVVEVKLRKDNKTVVYETQGKTVEFFLFFPVEVPKNVVVNASSGDVISIQTKSSFQVVVENLIDMIIFWA